MDAITGITVYKVTSPEKNDTKISNFGSVVCVLAHIVGDNVEAQNLFTKNPLVTMRIDKVKWITAHNCGKPKWHSFTGSFS